MSTEQRREMSNADINEYIENNINEALKVYLNYLIDYEYISLEDYKFLMKNTAIIIKKPSFFNKIWEKITNIKCNLFLVVEQKTMNEASCDTNNAPPTKEKNCPVIKFPEPE